MNSILEQLEINHTFLYQFGLFVAFYIILSQIYLKPFQKLLDQRQHRLKDDFDSSTELLKSIELKMGEYQKSLAAARTEARIQSEKVISEALAKEETVIASLKDDLKKEYQKAAQQLQDERKKVEIELQSHVDQLAEQLVTKIKGA